MSGRALIAILLSGFIWGAVVRVALADHYHVNCVGHGFVHGDSTSDGSFFARVEQGCGSTLRECDLYTNGNFIGGQVVAAAGHLQRLVAELRQLLGMRVDRARVRTGRCSATMCTRPTTTADEARAPLHRR